MNEEWLKRKFDADGYVKMMEVSGMALQEIFVCI